MLTPKGPITIRTRRTQNGGSITLFMFATSFEYSCKSSCSNAVGCGGGEIGCDVERENVEVIVEKDASYVFTFLYK